MRLIFAYIAGTVFGTGIALSGMINPAKVINFFDFAGTWDPSLAFVMGGALAVTFVGYRLVLGGAAPLAAPKFELPTRSDITVRLVAGAAIFGVGWGIAGFCPGGALPAIGLGLLPVYIFVAAMVAGIVITTLLSRATAGPSPRPANA